jgi:hypothetical protein
MVVNSEFMSELIMIEIVDSNQPIETRPCRLVHLPDGTRAALWRGLAWPIGKGDRIDIAGPAHPLLTQHLTSGPPFGLIDGAEEAWLVLEGSVTSRDAAAGALRQAGVAVLRSGPWLGEPVDGVAGTSFIRFVKPQTDDLRDSVAKILDGILALSPARPDPVDRVRALTIELMEAHAALARVQTTQAEVPPDPSADIERELGGLRQENIALLQEIADLRRQLAEAAPVRPEPGRASGRLQDEISALVATVRPDLRFLRDSLTVLVGEFADRRSLYRAVAELDADTLGRSWKKIYGAPGWRERHVSDGQDDSGRIYARLTGRCWDLLVSHKSQQARDVSWLARQPT